MNDSQPDENNDEVASPTDIRKLTGALFRSDGGLGMISKRKDRDAKRKGLVSARNLEFGIRFQSVSTSDSGKVVPLQEFGIGTLQALIRGFYEFLRFHPHLGLEFLEVFEERKLKSGFPEHIAGDSALATTLESVLLSVPENEQVEKVRIALLRDDNKALSMEDKAKLEDYFVRCVEILTTLSFSRLNFLVRVVRNISRERYEFNVFVAALHLNYVESRDVTPF